jgi:hypothetical protein
MLIRCVKLRGGQGLEYCGGSLSWRQCLRGEELAVLFFQKCMTVIIKNAFHARSIEAQAFKLPVASAAWLTGKMIARYLA